jgi:hypothetical protein
MEKPIFDLLKREYGATLKSFWDSYSVPVEGPYAFVIYETRPHENLEFLIHNLAYFCRGWRGVLFHSKDNAQFVKDILGPNAERMTLQCIDDVCGDVQENRMKYNTFVKSKHMWETMRGLGIRKVLMAETDSYLRRPIQPKDIQDIDYACSSWAWNESGIGGGGLTVRSVDRMLDIIERCPELNVIWAQDVWVAEGIQRVGGNVNNWMFAESILHSNPFGVHQWWTFSQFVCSGTLAFFLNYMKLEMD